MGRAQDTKLIEFLQKKLQGSLENEEKLRNDLASMKQQHINLNSQLISLKKLIESENINSPKSTAAAQNESERYASIFFAVIDL